MYEALRTTVFNLLLLSFVHILVIYSECKDQVTVDLVSRLSINGHKYVTMFLDPQIFDNFEVKYLPLPKRYDTNFNVPLSIDHSS